MNELDSLYPFLIFSRAFIAASVAILFIPIVIKRREKGKKKKKKTERQVFEILVKKKKSKDLWFSSMLLSMLGGVWQLSQLFPLLLTALFIFGSLFPSSLGKFHFMCRMGRTQFGLMTIALDGVTVS